MALINHETKEIHAKVVYFGPGRSGKTRSLERIYQKLRPEFRGKLKYLPTQLDRMLFFDFTAAEMGSISGYTIRFHLYTIPGEVKHDSSWRLVLKGCDGVVFVCDSTPERMDANQESRSLLSRYLVELGMEPQTLPLVLQFNKRDLDTAVSVDEMQRRLNPDGRVTVATSAATTDGVLSTLASLLKLIVKDIRATFPSADDHHEKPVQLHSPELTTEVADQDGPEDGLDQEACPEELVDTEPDLPVQLQEQEMPVCLEPVLDTPSTITLSTSGDCTLPLTIRCGDQVRTVTVRIAISLDDE